MDKEQWHLKYKKYVLVHFGYRCTMCNKHTEVNNGCIHHKTYIHDGGIYNVPASELIFLDKITWVCYKCHEYIHSTQSIDNITSIRSVTNNFCLYDITARCIDCGFIGLTDDFYDDFTCHNCYNRKECENENID